MATKRPTMTSFRKKALKKPGVKAEYDTLASAFELKRQMIAMRKKAGLTQEQVAECMGTTKSAVSRLEGVGKHSPSVSTLKKYAQAVGCKVEIRLVPASRPTTASTRQSLRDRG